MITIGTRGSKLALVQAHWVAGELDKRGLKNRIEIIKTKGDLVQDRFDKMEGKGFFTREIEEALHNGGIDLAVHCLKDLPTAMPKGLRLAAVTERENPFDVLISTKPFRLREDGMPDLDDTLIGTSSNRRVAGLADLYPKARFAPLRGNVPTRINKLKNGEAEVIVLAAAGLNRLCMDTDELFTLEAVPPLLVPAPAQGALGLQVREDDTRDLSFFNHRETVDCVDVERGILADLEGGCQLPLGVLVNPRGEGLYHMELFLGSLKQGVKGTRLSLSGTSPKELGDQARLHLREKGFLAG